MSEDLPQYFPRLYPAYNRSSSRSSLRMIIGQRNIVAETAAGVFITGSDNVVGERAQNIMLINSSGCTVMGGLKNVTIVNTSGATVTEDNTMIQNSGTIFSPGSGNASYKKYIGLITQSGTNAPVPTILENTIGAIVWTRVASSEYIGTLASAFVLNKTTCSVGAGDNNFLPSFYRASANVVNLTGVADGNMNNIPIEIRVYN